MLKRVLMLVGALLVSGSVFAAIKVEVVNGTVGGGDAVSTQELSFSAFGTPTTLSVSTSAWTLAPAASSLTSRTGVTVSVPASNTANIVAHVGDCPSTAVAISVRPMELIRGNGFTFFPVNNDACVWLLSLHTAAENVHVQEFK